MYILYCSLPIKIFCYRYLILLIYFKSSQKTLYSLVKEQTFIMMGLAVDMNVVTRRKTISQHASWNIFSWKKQELIIVGIRSDGDKEQLGAGAVGMRSSWDQEQLGSGAVGNRSSCEQEQLG